MLFLIAGGSVDEFLLVILEDGMIKYKIVQMKKLRQIVKTYPRSTVMIAGNLTTSVSAEGRKLEIPASVLLQRKSPVAMVKIESF